jgi:hypothetical protein
VGDESRLLTEHSARLGSADSLIPQQLPLPEGVPRILAEIGGEVTAVAVAAVETLPADSLDLSWTSATTYRLRARSCSCAGPAAI